MVPTGKAGGAQVRSPGRSGRRPAVVETEARSNPFPRGLGILNRIHRTVLEMAEAELGELGHASVLDIGCGPGRLLHAAEKRWPQARLRGVDPEDEDLTYAREKVPAAMFVRGTAEALPVPDASVDLAVSTLSLHHWEDQAAGFRETARALRSGGYFCLADGFPGPLLSRIMRHFGPQTPASTGALLEKAGFRERRRTWVLAHLVLVRIFSRV